MRAFSKSYFLKTMACAVALAAAAVLPACSGADEPAADTSTDRLSLRLNVTLSTVGDSRSRVDNGPDDYEQLPAGDFEKMTTLRVLLFAPDGMTLIGNRMVQVELIDGKYIPKNDNLVFPVESNELLYIYLIANEASLTLPRAVTDQSFTTIGQWFDSFKVKTAYNDLIAILDAWTVGYSSSNVSSSLFYTGENSHLPMTEKFRLLTIDKSKATIVGESGSNGSLIAEYMQEATLFVTPAAAKATFAFDFTGYKGSGVEVTGIRFSGVGQREYVFPNATDYSPAKYTKEGEEGGIVQEAENNERFITKFAVPTANSVVTYTFANGFAPVAMQAATGQIERGPIYFPETLSALAAKAFTVEVQLDGQTWLAAQPLTDNILQVDGNEAIARSTHLRINISFTPVGITWEAIEAPYNSVSLNPGFGDLYFPPEEP